MFWRHGESLKPFGPAVAGLGLDLGLGRGLCLGAGSSVGSVSLLVGRRGTGLSPVSGFGWLPGAAPCHGSVLGLELGSASDALPDVASDLDLGLDYSTIVSAGVGGTSATCRRDARTRKLNEKALRRCTTIYASVRTLVCLAVIFHDPC